MPSAIGLFDTVVVLAYLVAVVSFGVWVGRGQRGLDSYLLGGRNLPWWAVLFSIVATETSTVTFLSIPGLGFGPDGGNLLFLQLTIGYVLGRLIVVFFFLPHYFRGSLFTAYEVLDRRFGGATKQAASILFLVMRNLADGLRLFLTAILVQYLLGVDFWVCVVVLGTLTIGYTFVGGMASVVWNDCIQFFVYIGGALVAGLLILGYLGSGSTDSADVWRYLGQGWRHASEFALAHDKLKLFDWRFDLTRSYTVYSGVLGGIFVALATHGTDQLMVQRYLCARNQREAGRALALSGIVVSLQFALFLLIGVALACFYAEFPPEVPFQAGDEVFPAFIVDYLPMGVRGLVVAAVLSAAMSTLSSSLNSSATAAVNDLYLPRRRERPAERHLLWVSRALTVGFGVAQIGVALAGALVQESVVESVMAIAGFTAGSVLGVFFLGAISRRVRQRAALIGLLGGLAAMGAIVFSTDLAWPWFAVVGSMLTLTIGLLAELATGGFAGRDEDKSG